MTTTAEPEVDALEACGPERRTSARQLVPEKMHLEIAEWLLEREMSDPAGTLALPEAAECACQKLLDRLAKLITPSGCQALLARALHLVRVDFKFLGELEPGLPPEAYVRGVRQHVHGTAPDQVQSGLAALLATLLDLIVLFIGAYLMLRLLLEVWPNLPSGTSSQTW